MNVPTPEPPAPTRPPAGFRIPPRLWPGVALSALVAAVAVPLGAVGWFAAHGISALTAAIVLGVAIGNTWYPRFVSSAGAGVNFSRQSVLRIGVALYGLRLTLSDVGRVGVAGIVIDAVIVGATFLLTVLLGTRVFGVERRTAMLIGAGSSICGAAAVLAAEPVVGARPDQATIAVSTVVAFGTAAIFVYPALYALRDHGIAPFDAAAFGVYAGSTIHEVAQVFAAGRSVSETVADTAVIAKMVRVMMLAPFLLVLSAWVNRGAGATALPSDRLAVRVPWFAIWFIAAVVFNSIVPQSAILHAWIVAIDTFLLAMAMAALGITTQLRTVREAGLRPLLLAGVIFLWLIVGGGAINWGVRKALALA